MLGELARYFTLSGRRAPLLEESPCRFFSSVCQLSLVLRKVYYLVFLRLLLVIVTVVLVLHV